MNNLKLPNVLVHLHLYYPEQLDYMLKKLKNINNCNWDLIVTICKENPKIERKIKEFKSDSQIIKVKNIGYDVWPFIQVLESINLDDYDYVLKLHTKNHRKHNNFFWRNILIDALLLSPKRYEQNLQLFKESPEIGIIGAEEVASKMTGICAEENELFFSFCKKYNLNLTKGVFISGTMFMIRSSILKSILALNLKEEDFYCVQKTDGKGTIAHVLERVFCRIAELKGYKIHTIKTPRHQIKLYIKTFIKNIFAVQNYIYNGEKHKRLNILGFKIKLN